MTTEETLSLLADAVELVDICKLVLQISEERKLDLPVASTLMRIKMFEERCEALQEEKKLEIKYD